MRTARLSTISRSIPDPCLSPLLIDRRLLKHYLPTTPLLSKFWSGEINENSYLTMSVRHIPSHNQPKSDSPSSTPSLWARRSLRHASLVLHGSENPDHSSPKSSFRGVSQLTLLHKTNMNEMEGKKALIQTVYSFVFK